MNVGRVEDKGAWLKSPEMKRSAWELVVCNCGSTVSRSSQAEAASADGGDVHGNGNDVKIL